MRKISRNTVSEYFPHSTICFSIKNKAEINRRLRDKIASNSSINILSPKIMY